MPLQRAADRFQIEKPKKERKKHRVTPIVGEFGRYAVDSHTLAKFGREGTYIVDIFEKEQTDQGEVVGTCPCKGWQIRKTCSHLEDAREEHNKVLAAQAETLGFDALD